MAELIAFAGVSITVPIVLRASWTILKSAYNIYGNVDGRRRQIGLLLDRYKDIIAKLSKWLNDNPEALTTAIRANVEDLQKSGYNIYALFDYLRLTDSRLRACEGVYAIVEKLRKKGFLWCMMNQGDIDIQIVDVERRVATAFELFNVRQPSTSVSLSLRQPRNVVQFSAGRKKVRTRNDASSAERSG